MAENKKKLTPPINGQGREIRSLTTDCENKKPVRTFLLFTYKIDEVCDFTKY